MAEGVFQHVTKDAKEPHPLINNIDSAGTGAYHIGDPPDPRTMDTLEANGITSYIHEARKFQADDFNKFDYIMAMDDDNLSFLKRLRAKMLKQSDAGEESLGRVMLWGDFGGRKGEEVVDPYYGAKDGFTLAYEQMVRFSKGFLKHLEDQDKQVSNRHEAAMKS